MKVGCRELEGGGVCVRACVGLKTDAGEMQSLPDHVGMRGSIQGKKGTMGESFFFFLLRREKTGIFHPSHMLLS